MMRLFDLGLVIASIIGGSAGEASCQRSGADGRAKEIAVKRSIEAWRNCGAEDSIRQGDNAKNEREHGRELSPEIVLRDRWSDCLERFANDNWFEFARAGGAERRVAQRLFLRGLRHCRSDGEALRALAGNKTFREERQYNRDMIVERYELMIIEERTSEI